MNIKGKEYNVLNTEDIINERWMVVNDSTDEDVCIRFTYLTDKDLESLRVHGVIPDLEPNENAIWVCCEDGDIFVCEYYNYDTNENDFNGYKHFESVTDAMEWCEEHSNEEIHQLLSK